MEARSELNQTPSEPRNGPPSGAFVAPSTRTAGKRKERCFVQLQQAAPVKASAVPKVVVWEALDATDPMTQAASKLYEETLAADERIPWMWIEQSVHDRTKSKPRPGGWSRHLLLAAPEGRQDDPAALAGYVYGALLPGYGGYLCYVGVADWCGAWASAGGCSTSSSRCSAWMRGNWANRCRS